MTLGQFIKEKRLELGLSQRKLAKKANCSSAFISKLENNEYEFTSPKTLNNLATALNIEEDLIYDAARSKDFEYKKAPPKSIQDLTIREISNNFIEVPIIADMHAPGQIMEYLYLPRSGNSHVNLSGVKILGNCLAPKVEEGDIIIIDKDDYPDIGKMLLCYHNGEEHPSIIKYKKPKDIENCEIYGVIAWIMKKP